MKRLFASLGVAAILAVGLVLGGAGTSAGVVHACMHSTYGQAKYQSYYNYATGQYASIGFQAVKENDCNQTFWGYIYVWSSDGFNISGSIGTRIWLNGNNGNNSSCGLSGTNSFACYTKYMYGASTSSESVDDGTGTGIRDAFGGQHYMYVVV